MLAAWPNLPTAARGQACPHRRLAPVRLLLWGLACLCLLATPLGAAESSRYEAEKVKAAFVFSFARYIEWPPTAFVDSTAPFVIGVTPRAVVAGELKEIIRTRTLHARPIVLQEVHSTADAVLTHLLFIDPADERSLLADLVDLARKGVVTVGESERFEQAGGLLTLSTDAERLRFRINGGVRDGSPYKLSSQLLKLAAPGVERKKP